MPFLALSLALLLSACSSGPELSPEEREAEVAAQATDECLARPELAKTWGECNVKKTIFDRKEPIGRCQARFGKGGNGEPLMLMIRLRNNGKVRTVRAEQGGPRNKPLEQCLSREISRLRFAPPPKGVKPVIYFPFEQ